MPLAIFIEQDHSHTSCSSTGWFSPPPQRTLACLDIFLVVTLRKWEDAAGIQWVETRDA